MTPLRVLTLNIWNKQGGWLDRLPLIRRAIEALNPDVIGLQEVLRLDPGAQSAGDGGARAHDSPDNNQAVELAHGFGYATAFGAAWHIGGGLHFGNAVLSRFPIGDTQCLQLPGISGEETRALLATRLQTPHGALPFFVTHLDWQFDRGHIRERQVVFIADRVAELSAGAELPAILVGDFNAEPDSDEIRWLQGLTARPAGRSVYYADAWRIAGPRDSDGATFARRNRFAAPLGEPDRRIDYIFVRAPESRRGRALSCRVVCDEPVGDVFPSDHFGVFAEICVTR